MKKADNTPLVTAIIPTFNRGWILKEAVQSVLDQTYNPLEIIVVDDGSTDDTREILHSFGDRITVLSQENKGVSAARNLGIRQSHGELIALLDSDDLWTPDKIACQVDFFNNHPEAEICQTEEIWIRNGKRVNPKNKHKKLSGMIFKPSLELCLVSPSAVMIRRSLFELKGYFDEELPACEDYDLWLRIATTHAIDLIDRACTVKRGGHEDQLSSHHSLDQYRIRSIEKLLEADSLTGEQREAALEIFRSKARIYGQGCIKRGRIEEGNRYLAKSDPSTLHL
ncbi:MAG: glycosyltransferase [Desulfobacteraceae bacterium]|nr:glycosyltransferase [Desulfobacteraceae bacterium]